MATAANRAPQRDHPGQHRRQGQRPGAEAEATERVGAAAAQELGRPAHGVGGQDHAVEDRDHVVGPRPRHGRVVAGGDERDVDGGLGRGHAGPEPGQPAEPPPAPLGHGPQGQGAERRRRHERGGVTDQHRRDAGQAEGEQAAQAPAALHPGGQPQEREDHHNVGRVLLEAVVGQRAGATAAASPAATAATRPSRLPSR
jgi:hypothetical protein